jgi:hypothetical protein
MQSMQKNLTIVLLSLNHSANHSYILYTAINFRHINNYELHKDLSSYYLT